MENTTEPGQETKTTFDLHLLYALIGIAASFGFALLLYWSLRLNSSISTLIVNTAQSPLYIWLYGALTLGTIILFGINVALFVRNWRFFGRPNIKNEAGTTLGGIVGLFASACPTCGSLLLSAVGITSGLLAFPLAGLELKALAFILMGISVWLSVRTMRKKCHEGTCARAHDAFTDNDKRWIVLLGGIIILFISLGYNSAQSEPFLIAKQSLGNVDNQDAAAGADALFDEMSKIVTPQSGFQSKIVLGDVIQKIVAEGVIDPKKVHELYEENGGVPEKFTEIMTTPETTPILLTQDNAPYYLNALWALGLANHMEANKASPVVGKDLFNFASTGGWTLGTQEKGGSYFNNYPFIVLTTEQEALVQRVAENTYRPCCDNSSFFQDCNHGSALLGLLELGAAQGLSEKDLYREALGWNSFWFPQNYIEIAMYFEVIEHTDWADVDPRLAMSKYFSSGSGWYKNVYQKLEAKGLIPKTQVGGTGC